MTLKCNNSLRILWRQLIIIAIICLIPTSYGLNCTSDPCMYGICLDNDNSYSCYCIDGYTGINCEINWDDCWSNPCYNDGTCNDGVASYNCTCPDGFIGVNCETKYSECLNQPCLNNGTCIDYNGFTCQCQEGYSGDYCEIDVSVCNSTICKNGGECIDGPGYSYNCHCRDGWTGELCEEDIDECLSSPCQNGGLCLNVPATYTCACLFGFTGKDCDKLIISCEENPCKNEAMCLLEDNQPVCYCVPDYHGQLCELRYNDCESKFARCENGGMCVDGINSFMCSCPSPYTGEMCSIYNPALTTEFHQININTTEKTGEAPIFTTSVFTSPQTQVTEYELDRQSTTEKFTELTSPITENSTKLFTSSTNSTIMNDTRTESPVVYETTTDTYQYTTSQLITSLDYLSSTTEDNLDKTTAPETSTNVFQINETKKLIKNFSTETSLDSYTKVPIVQLNATDMTSSSLPSTMSTIKLTSWSSEINLTTELSSEAEKIITTSMPTILTSTKIFNESLITFEIPTSSTIDLPMTIPTLSELTTDKSHITSTIMYSTEAEGRSKAYNCTDDCIHVTPCTSGNSSQCDCDSSDCTPAVTQSSTITNAAFNGKSYVRQQLKIDDSGLLKIYLRLKTKSKSGIIMHAFFDEERYVLLYMELGQLKFQFSCGLQTMLLGEIDSPINNGRDVDIEMRFKYLVENDIGKCSARLFVNNTMAMSGEQMLTAHTDIPQIVRVHFGGIPQAFSHYFPRIALGFIGCMSMLKVNDIQRHFVLDSVETFQIEECTSFLCLLNPCRNFGSCHDIDGKVYCKCIPGYTGELCEKTACDDNPCYLGSTCISSPGTGFICVCPLNMHGRRCEEESIIVDPSFSVFIPGFSSYVAYGINGIIQNYMEIKMRIMPHSVDQISLLAYMGQGGASRDTSDHFSVTYVKGYIMLTWDLGSGVRRIFTKRPLSSRTRGPYMLHVGRRGRDAWLFVDGIGNVTGQAAGTMNKLNVSPLLYIGGHKSKNFETLPHDLPLHTGFTGCIYEIELRTENTVIPVTKSSPASGRGVGECHRNECSYNTCKNGAVCLNHGPTYSCICMKEWQGPDCTVPAVSCSSSNPSCQSMKNI
ncbi:Similar to eys: Protein eyes shut (Drosophila melanogaster) [Cotesia congregata]|uniref:Similar to eys: Protein eyes shut (Drosophila melanogaster) n=1 Tax=Cotesia congregata TaxID=51543 RepID=A0A8J2HKZ0_COTCN|nr:Similar to eys: Protein eyes shut (Drosophila melanogaster) [Cotesia congregata]